MMITVSGVECSKCHDRFWSRHFNDFRNCTCGTCFVKGGRHDTQGGSRSSLITALSILIQVPESEVINEAETFI
jgi:hypothetical protein